MGPATLRRPLGIDQLPVKRWGDRSFSGGKGTIARAGGGGGGGSGGGDIISGAITKTFAHSQPLGQGAGIGACQLVTELINGQ